jgi:hypothetical protein
MFVGGKNLTVILSVCLANVAIPSWRYTPFPQPAASRGQAVVNGGLAPVYRYVFQAGPQLIVGWNEIAARFLVGDEITAIKLRA